MATNPHNGGAPNISLGAVVGDVVDDEVGQRPAPGEGVGESGGPVVGEYLGGVLPWGAG